MDLDERRLDGLTLIALGRIPRCAGCPRYAALVSAHAAGTNRPHGLPVVPLYCTHQVCAPLAARFVGVAPAPAVHGLPLAG
jgi:hypothetical protein